MELFVYPHTIGAVQDLLVDKIVELKHEVSKLQLKPRGEVDDLTELLSTIQWYQGKIDVFGELLEQIEEYNAKQ